MLNGERAELHVEVCASSAQQLNTEARRDGDLKIFATTHEGLDLDENPIVENTQGIDLSKHEHDVARGREQRGE